MSEEQMKVVYSMVIGQGIIILVLLMAQRNLHQQAYWILILNVVAMQFSLWQRFIGIVSKFFNFVKMPCLFGLYALCAVNLRVYFVNNYFPVNSVWKVAIKKPGIAT